MSPSSAQTKESFALSSTSLSNISATRLHGLSSLYPSWSFILNCSSSLTKLVVYIYRTSNSALNQSEMDIPTFNSLENTLDIICCLPDLYQMSRLNRYKYSEACTKHKLSLSIEDVVNEVCLTIPMEAP